MTTCEPRPTILGWIFLGEAINVKKNDFGSFLLNGVLFDLEQLVVHLWNSWIGFDKFLALLLQFLIGKCV